MQLLEFLISAILNLLLLGAAPFFVYYAYHRWRHKRSLAEVAGRAGLQIGESRYILYGLMTALVAVAILAIWPPPVEPFIRPGSPQQAFAGLGIGGRSIVMALLYGVVKTGVPEELLFRGMIGGSLSRRLPVPWANLAQAVIFLLPHLFVLKVMPEMWMLLPIIFVVSLAMGWLRIRSGSIFPSAIVHAAVNTAICLVVAARTST